MSVAKSIPSVKRTPTRQPPVPNRKPLKSQRYCMHGVNLRKSRRPAPALLALATIALCLAGGGGHGRRAN